LGRDPLLFAELLTRGDELIVTYPEADQGGPRAAEGALTRGARTPPALPAGSSLELGDVRPYSPVSSKVSLKRPSVQALSRYDRCAFRFWAEGSPWSETPHETPWWRVLVAKLRTLGRLNAARLAVLASSFPAASGWLSEHEALLLTLTFGVTLPERGDGPYARLDAATRTGGAVRLYTFMPPEFDGDAPAFVGGRSNELWAAAHLLEKHRMGSVELYLWPLLGLPQAVYDAPLTRVLRPLESKQRFVARVYARFETGEASPKPGFDCRACGVFDLCRAGTR